MNSEESQTVNRQGGQGNYVIAFVSACAVVYGCFKNPQYIPLPDPVIDFVRAKFSEASQKPKPTPVSKSDCPVVPISHSPYAMMVMAEKFPDAGCAPTKK